jgi:hypothetical protein
MDRDFQDILRQVRDSGEQKDFENRDLCARWKVLGVGLLFGVLTVSTSVSAFSDASWWITGLLGVVAVMAFAAWDRANIQLVLVAKDQDRQYFLACIRSAKSIDELKQVGLFEHAHLSDRPAWVAQVKVDVANLRKALETEPEWFEAI